MTEEKKVDMIDEEQAELLADAEENVEAEDLKWEMNAEEFDLTEIASQLAKKELEKEELQQKLEEAENRMYRIQADFDNHRRRVQLDKEAAMKFRSQNLITDILPVLDTFERALIVEETDEKITSFLQGIEMVQKQLLEALEKEGLTAIQAVGATFDPNFHQAVMTVEDENFATNTVVEEFQKGYMLKDRVIRPSMVKVNQ